MKKIVYIISIIAFLAILTALFMFIKIYNKPHTDVNTSVSDYTVTIENIANDFNQNEEQANQKYLDKIIQIEGIIKNVDILDGHGTITLTDSKDPTKTVVCNMAVSENMKMITLQQGQKITIKGICTGYLMDVMLVKTVIVN